VSERQEDTALGTARARFIDGLVRKAAELKGSLALIAGSPDADRPREEMRRRLHALYASAQVFRIESLATALKEGIDRLDSARDTRRSLEQEDLDALANLASTLPALSGDVEPGKPSKPPPPMGADEPLRVPPRQKLESPRERRTTLSGIMAARRQSVIDFPAVTEDPFEATTIPGETDADSLRDSFGLDSMSGADELESSAGPSEHDASASDSRWESSDAESAQEPPPPARVADDDEPFLTERSPAEPGLDEPGNEAFGAFARAEARPSSLPTALDTVLSVLVVDSADVQARVRDALDAERFEVLGAADPEEALRIARSSAPDVVVADRDRILAEGVDFVERLRSDPDTDFVPIVSLLAEGTADDLIAVREDGIDDVLHKPFEPRSLERVIRRVTGTLGADRSTGEFGELTASELVDRLSAELRRGLSDAAETGREVKIPIGDGAEILAAAWSAIARVRAHVAERTKGAVRFRDTPRRGPAVMALVDDAGEADPTPVDLGGRRIVVADDDPAVVWFFAGLLREAGATVIEAENGRRALEAARRRHPDVVISDILMPELDGFALSRALARDPALIDVPVILISWKEDFLQRMRDLDAGAKGYLRKEAKAAQILSKVREVLAPRARLEARLLAGGDVRGRIEGLGLPALVRMTARLRPDARITARDAWNLFEVDLRGGNVVAVTRTASDGSFARGKIALGQLFGVTSGRFAVSDSAGAVRATIDEPLEDLVRRGTDELGALLDAVSGRNLHQAARLRLDDDVAAACARTSPAPVQELIDRLRNGESPRALLAEDGIDPSFVESVLTDLARRGAITSVEGPDGEDRVKACLEDRRSNRDVPGTVPPPPAEETASERENESASEADAASADSSEPQAAAPLSDEISSELRDLAAPLLETPVRETPAFETPVVAPPADASEPNAPEADASEPDAGDARPARSRRDSAAVALLDAPFAEPTETPPLETSIEPPPSREDSSPIDLVRKRSVAPGPLEPASSGRSTDPEAPPAPEERPRFPDEAEGLQEEDTFLHIKPDRDAIEVPRAEAEAETEEDDQEKVDAEETSYRIEPARDGLTDVGASLLKIDEESPAASMRDEATEEDIRPPETSERRPMRIDPPPVREPSQSLRLAQAAAAQAAAFAAREKEKEPPPKGSSFSTYVWWGLLLLALAAIGFVGFRIIESELGGGPSVIAPDLEAPETLEETTPETGETPPPRERPDMDGPVELTFGQRVVENVETAMGAVPADHGLLVIEPRDEHEVTVTIDGREAAWPVNAPIREGMHAIEMQRGDEHVFRFVTVERGTTYFLPGP
jgi:CheY-like chemotaxis protein